ncbi:hypothetical protein [Bacillus halotolerans]
MNENRIRSVCIWITNVMTRTENNTQNLHIQKK